MFIDIFMGIDMQNIINEISENKIKLKIYKKRRKN